MAGEGEWRRGAIHWIRRGTRTPMPRRGWPAIYVGSQTKQLVGSLLQLFFSAHDVVTASIKYRADSLFAARAYVLSLVVDSELNVNFCVRKLLQASDLLFHIKCFVMNFLV